MSKSKPKNKEYKYFSFPNNLTPLETYYYYMVEFGVFPNPNEIFTRKLIEIFNAAARDYIDGFLSTAALAYIASNSLVTSEDVNKITPGLGVLIAECSELEDEYLEEIEETKLSIKMYLNNPQGFSKQRHEQDRDKIEIYSKKS